MAFKLFTEMSQLPEPSQSFVGAPSKGWLVFQVGGTLDEVGLSGLLKVSDAGEVFHRNMEKETLIEKGQDPVANFLSGILKGKVPKKSGPTEQYLKMRADRNANDAQIFGEEGHRLSVNTVEAAEKLSSRAHTFLEFRPANHVPDSQKKMLDGLNTAMTTIMSDPNISYCPKLLEYAQTLYTMATSDKPLMFDEAAEAAGLTIRTRDLAVGMPPELGDKPPAPPRRR